MAQTAETNVGKRPITRCSVPYSGRVELPALIAFLFIGALISLTPPEQGGIYWTAKQIEISRNLPNNPNVQIPISWSLGPIKVTSPFKTGATYRSLQLG